MKTYEKNCIFCKSSNVKKNGHRRSVQMYLCKDCGGRQFQGGLRINNVSLVVSEKVCKPIFFLSLYLETLK